MIHRRSRAREVALQCLFWRDVNKKANQRVMIEFSRDRLKDPKAERFSMDLYNGVVQNLKEIDQKIVNISQNWRISRMQIVDRNVLRIGVFEMLYYVDRTAVAVAIDESIELARRFGSADSPSFINGILDKIHQADNQATPPTETVVKPSPIRK